MKTPGRLGNIESIPLGLLFFLSIGFSIGFSSAAEAATREWVGASGGQWSVGANWNPVGPPAAGDDLVFPAGTSAISVNDIPGPTALQSIRFDDPHTIQGAGAISVTAGIEVLAAAAIQTPIQLMANAAISGTATLAVSGTMTAPGDFAITGVTVDASNANNAFTGTMTINTGGTFLVSAAGALGSAVPATVGAHLAGGTLRVSAANTSLGINRLTGDGTLDLGNQSPSIMFTVWIAATNLFTGNIAGSFGIFQKAGAGTLTLGGATTYAGMTYLSVGELVIAHPQALSDSTISVVQADTSTLIYDVISTRTKPLSLYGAGLNGAGVLRLRGGSLTQAHSTFLQNDPATIAVAAPHQLLLQGPVQGPGQLTVIGDGAVVLNNANNTVGGLVIGNGVGPGPTLQAGVAGALTSIPLTVNAGGTLNLGGLETTLFNITGTGRIDTGGSNGLADLRGNNATFSGTYHGAGSASVLFTTNTVTLAGTSTLAKTFETTAPHLIVKGTIPSVVRSIDGNKVTLEPGSVTGLLYLASTSSSAELIAGDAINPAGATTGGLQMLGGTFKPMLSSTSPRITVNGTVTINGMLDLTYAGAIPPGVLTLISNDGDDPISGIFGNAGAGSDVTLNGVKYIVSYRGGDGNDLTLTPPTSYHLSEGATGTFFDTDLLLANPWTFEINVEVTFLPENAAPLTQQYTLAPVSRRTIRVDQISGMESVAFSTIVKPDIAYPIAVERTMRWDATGYGGHTEKATAGPATTWYFAEGSEGFFRTFLLLANPQTTANVAHVTWLREGTGPIVRTYDLLPTSRKTIAALDDPELVNQAFGMTVTFDQPGVAERAMYFGGPPVFKGGHESAGVTAPATTWLLAEGATGDGFDTFILVANPGSEAADVTFTFLPESGAPATLTRRVDPNSRITVNPEGENLSIPLGPVATQVVSTKPVIAERAQYWPLGPVQWTEAHNSFGVTEAARFWALAEGRVGGSEGYQTYILLANPGNTPANVTLEYLEDGQTQKPASTSVTVGAQQRFNVAVPAMEPNVVATFGTFIVSDQPIVVERAMYWNVGGEVWAAGTNATATQIRMP